MRDRSVAAVLPCPGAVCYCSGLLVVWKRGDAVNGARGGEPIPPARGTPAHPRCRPTHPVRRPPSRPRTLVALHPGPRSYPGRHHPSPSGATGALVVQCQERRRASVIPAHRDHRPTASAQSPTPWWLSPRTDASTRPARTTCRLKWCAAATPLPGRLAAVVYACLYLVGGEGSLSHVFLSVR